jgi:hypothetical protein
MLLALPLAAAAFLLREAIRRLVHLLRLWPGCLA